MDFSTPPRRKPAESIVPMINVVFLLLIFFLMTSRLAQPDPFEITVPVAGLDTDPQAEPVLFVGPNGQLAFDDHKGEAVWPALAAADLGGQTLLLRADAKVEATRLAGLLRKLTDVGLGDIELVVSPQ